MKSNPDPVEPHAVRVTVDRVVHHHGLASTPSHPHCFVYFITIHNRWQRAVTIKGRKWVITNARGEVIVVEGAGVIGQFPRIEAGGKFKYNSFHLIDTATATAEGSFLGVDDEGIRVIARIPRFEMAVTYLA